MKVYHLIVLLFAASYGFAQEKEVMVIGTMHTVPKIAWKSYKPLYRIAKKYHPQAIYVERPMPEDSISWEYLKDGWSKGYQKFYQLSDSLKNTLKVDPLQFEMILGKPFESMSPEDLNYLIKAFTAKRDYANYYFYSFLLEYGIKGPKKATRNENGDLTSKLAISENIKVIYSMDDQQSNEEYHEAWTACRKSTGSSGEYKIKNKMYRQDMRKSVIHVLFGGLGKYNNKVKASKRMHDLNSFRYASEETPGCKEGAYYWDQRNLRMAKNIGEQVLANDAQRSVVVVGAGHLYGLIEALKANYPEIKVRRLKGKNL